MSEESIVIDQIDPNKAVAIFTGGLDDILTKIAADLKKDLPDISTKKGREEIASRAYKASRCKTKLDDMGKELNEEAQKHIAAVNADRNRAKTFLDNLRDEIRKPLDEWEAAEESRVKGHEDALEALSAYAVLPAGCHSQYISDTLQDIVVKAQGRDWEEFALRAQNLYADVCDKLNAALAAAQKYEAEQAELEAFRAEKAKRDAEEAERQRIAHEVKIAAEAAEKARKEVKDEAARKAKEAADKAAAEIAAAAAAEEKAKQEAAAAEERARKAEADAKAAAEQAERDRIAAAKKAEADRIAAQAKAKLEQEAAVEAERKRAADAKAAEDAATAKREADKAHRAKINNEALKALAAMDCVLGEIPAKAIVIAIAEGKIPHVKIQY